MDTTTNYGLSKPGLDGPADIEVLGQNADIVDTELKKAQDHRENSNDHMSTAEKGTLNSAVQSATFGGTAVPQDGTKLEIPMPTAEQVGASNPNLLINPCGNVNQRGQSVYANIGYTVDRWIHGYTSGTIGTVIEQGGAWAGTVGKRYIRLKVESVNSPDTDYLAQYIEDNDNGYSSLAGETVTFSFFANLSNCSYRAFGLCWRDASNTYQQEIKDILNSSGRYSITVTLPSGIRSVAVQIICSRAITSADVGSFIDITEAKLEIGSVATPFSPRPYAEELALCQRYYEMNNDLLFLTPYDTDETIELREMVQFKVTKRATPTVTIKSSNGTIGKIGRYNGSGWDDVDYNSAFAGGTNTEHYIMQANVSPRSYYNWSSTADAEIY